ncbi:MAG: hypothetical protein H6537_01320 [Bacteroidales bacterium]|nr:hypothetical protein [Bacteroidales bacterium]HPD96059.1 hypothetical protein [Tenuifilaceae bacterium]HRX31279.1 hypothetical protein [Tenuifilaceae bacterium]
MTKKRIVVDYSNLSAELQESFKKKYPYGYNDYLMKVQKPNGDYFYAVTLETDEASYLVKVKVKVDTKIKDEDEEKDFFGSMSDDIGTEQDTFPEDLGDDEPAEEMGDF